MTCLLARLLCRTVPGKRYNFNRACKCSSVQSFSVLNFNYMFRCNWSELCGGAICAISVNVLRGRALVGFFVCIVGGFVWFFGLDWGFFPPKN